jgi:hypothetical protein
MQSDVLPLLNDPSEKGWQTQRGGDYIRMAHYPRNHCNPEDILLYLRAGSGLMSCTKNTQSQQHRRGESLEEAWAGEEICMAQTDCTRYLVFRLATCQHKY